MQLLQSKKCHALASDLARACCSPSTLNLACSSRSSASSSRMFFCIPEIEAQLNGLPLRNIQKFMAGVEALSLVLADLSCSQLCHIPLLTFLFILDGL